MFPGSYLMMSSSLLIGANSEAVMFGSAAILQDKNVGSIKC